MTIADSSNGEKVTFSCPIGPITDLLGISASSGWSFDRTFKSHPEIFTGIVLFVLLSVISPLPGVISEITIVPDNSDGSFINEVLAKTSDEKSHEILIISFGLELFIRPIIVILGPFAVTGEFVTAGRFVAGMLGLWKCSGADNDGPQKTSTTKPKETSINMN
ncbi:Uncharacterised protein [uncultured archaeon]|nr:Uncharacterised protein [uncultured archaeon]